MFENLIESLCSLEQCLQRAWILKGDAKYFVESFIIYNLFSKWVNKNRKESKWVWIAAELSIEDNGSIFLACDTIMNILLRRKQINFSLEWSTFSSLLKVLAYWASGAKDPSVVIMATSICSLIFDFTSEDVLHNTIISA